MREEFLHFIWQNQYFDKERLKTVDGQIINIIHPGYYNTDSGPDFKQAKIEVEGIAWVGQVEIHIAASAWHAHGHEKDAAYQNVVLHVVWKADEIIYYPDGTPIPTLEIADRVDAALLKRGELLINSPATIPCSNSLEAVSSITISTMKERVLMERLALKTTDLKILLRHNDYDWEETSYQWLAKSMGFKINSDPMLRTAQTVKLQWLKKHRKEPRLIEALLFGVSGLLPKKPLDEYTRQLISDYAFLKVKYKLQSKERSATEWKFMRTRPANFPTIRISQLAGLLVENPNIFSLFTQFESSKKLRDSLSKVPGDYWKKHYRFGVESNRNLKGIGQSSIQNLMINTVAPLLISYGYHIDDPKWIEKAISILDQIPKEENSITRAYEKLGFENNSAYDSQALIGLHKMYCKPHKCLQCQIGAQILKR